MPARVIMVQGTASHVGKSLLVAAWCRILAQDGVRVAPFKAQNMSLNAAVTIDGGEIGRAQMLQAQAARTLARVEMNPVLLKPQAGMLAQVVVLGRVWETLSPQRYYTRGDHLWPSITAALDTLRQQYDVIVIEGAGSPAEVNLGDRDLANMRVARYANAPVVLVGDVERGGVFASLVGTLELLADDDRRLVRGFVINKFRGDPTLLEPGPELLRRRTLLPTFGVIPFLDDLRLPEEDSVGLGDRPRSSGATALDVAVVRLPHIANFDDFDPLARAPGIQVRFPDRVDRLGQPDLVILPGSKSTSHDLRWLDEHGFSGAIRAHRAAGGAVLGVCGGYQMLGRTIRDPDHVESPDVEISGLGLLDIETVFAPVKLTRQVRGTAPDGAGLLRGCGGLPIEGYEIHRGRSTTDWATDADGLVVGTYLHGIFHNRAFRRRFLENLAQRHGRLLPPESDAGDLDRELDRLADHVRRSLNMPAIYRLIDHHAD